MDEKLNGLTQAIIAGNRTQSKDLTDAVLAAGAPAEKVLEACVAAMDEVGRRFQAHEVFVPEMLISSRAMKVAMTVLEPRLVAAGIKPKYTAVIGTVQGDLHDIGKNLVAMMWKGANVAVVDLGTNVPPEKFVDAIKEHKAQIVGLSALLTTTMPAMRTATKAIRDAGLTDVKVVVGGAPVTQSFADEIGANGFAADAGSAVELVRRLIPA